MTTAQAQYDAMSPPEDEWANLLLGQAAFDAATAAYCEAFRTYTRMVPELDSEVVFAMRGMIKRSAENVLEAIGEIL